MKWSWVIGALLCLLSCERDCKDDCVLKLDEALDNYQTFIEQKEHMIFDLKNKLRASKTLDDQYYASMDLYQIYQYFSLDSAFIYIAQAQELADSMASEERIIDTKMSLAFLYNFAGMPNEALEIFNATPLEALPFNLRRTHHYLGFNIYNTLKDQTIESRLKETYVNLMKSYRDSAITYSPNDLILKTEKLSDEQKYEEAITLISQNLPDGLTSNEAGLKYFILSEIYERLGNQKQQIRYLAMASTASVVNAVRQYVALRKLAVLLYDNGDTDRAYKYIHTCIEDARACNSHTRLLEASTIMPIIDSTMVQQKQSHRNFLIASLTIIVLLAMLLLVMLRRVHGKNTKLKSSQKELSKANEEFKNLNTKLHEANLQLSELNREAKEASEKLKMVNRQLEETSQVKTEYITRFMKLCLEYISKMEKYRQHLSKVAAKRNFDLLYDTIQSSRYISQEASDFYDNFDEAFLNIYPHFVEDLNKLLKPECQIILKNGERLTTELRVYALFKLGITDSPRIQEFLRCSASTVYNYRTTMRNRATDRDNFEGNFLS